MVCALAATQSGDEPFIDENVLQKDLYTVLGLTKSATVKEIKKAYRKLAQQYHPDKASAEEKESSADVFRNVAEAYEVLSNKEHRKMYDDERNRREARDKAVNNSKGRYGSYRDPFAEEESEGTYYPGFSNSHYNSIRPVLGGSMIQPGQIIFPYSPILRSLDGLYFAFLDVHCSFGVYKGDPDDLVRHLLLSDDAPDLTNLAVELRFRTDPAPSLNGRCFAGLDAYGIFRVYRGHPDFGDFYPLWSSSGPPSDGTTYFNPYFQQFYLELGYGGELAIRVVHAGSSESECVWSTTSCNAVLRSVKEFKSVVMSLGGRISQLARQHLDALHAFVEEVKRDGIQGIFANYCRGVTDWASRILSSMKKDQDRRRRRRKR